VLKRYLNFYPTLLLGLAVSILILAICLVVKGSRPHKEYLLSAVYIPGNDRQLMNYHADRICSTYAKYTVVAVVEDNSVVIFDTDTVPAFDVKNMPKVYPCCQQGPFSVKYAIALESASLNWINTPTHTQMVGTYFGPKRRKQIVSCTVGIQYLAQYVLITLPKEDEPGRPECNSLLSAPERGVRRATGPLTSVLEHPELVSYTDTNAVEHTTKSNFLLIRTYSTSSKSTP
jgi:hypothetical protein